jgi:serine/threonine protein phosphatase PrpC
MPQPTVLSEVGLRSNNEDAVFASSRLVAVADGVGGAAAGELASQLTILKMVALDKRRLLQPLDRELSNAVADANDLVSLATLYEPRNAGMATTLLRVLNGAEREPPGLRTVPALEGDRLLLCSDGVTDYLTDAQVAEYLAIEESAEAVRYLVEAAPASGSRDNVSAVVADVIARTDSDDGWLDALPLSLRAG